MERMTMKIDGMSCSHCVNQVTKALKDLRDIEVEQVKVGGATVSYDPASNSPDRIRKAVEDQGYAVTGTTS
ncbi:MAG: heavy-metal-associated domain-containing protein [Gemmatimonadaceae bacterium]|nr:heavy-metal-associated domain-containing protein [Gemmatimonadaceae bacterium]MDQ3518513.1 cation transporter [Gemmatimonadota bacterium]